MISTVRCRASYLAADAQGCQRRCFSCDRQAFIVPMPRGRGSAPDGSALDGSALGRRRPHRRRDHGLVDPLSRSGSGLGSPTPFLRCFEQLAHRREHPGSHAISSSPLPPKFATLRASSNDFAACTDPRRATDLGHRKLPTPLFRSPCASRGSPLHPASRLPTAPAVFRSWRRQLQIRSEGSTDPRGSPPIHPYRHQWRYPAPPGRPCFSDEKARDPRTSVSAL